MEQGILSANDMSPGQLEGLISGLSDRECAELKYTWDFWARPNQRIPSGNWLTWLLLAGRGYGKTRVGAETTRHYVENKVYGRIGLVAETAADARDVMVNGESGIIACSPPWFRPKYEPTYRRLVWPNGAIATLFSSEDPDALRGHQFDFAWSDELCKWKYMDATWDQLQFCLRLGTNPRQLVTTTPRPVAVLKRLIHQNATVITKGSTEENEGNLAPSFVSTVYDMYSGTRLGRQELSAEILDDNPGALFNMKNIEKARVKSIDLDELDRIVVAIDPAVTANKKSNETGIVVAGRKKMKATGTVSATRHGFLLDDVSVGRVAPAVWAKKAVDAYYKFEADAIVVEVNNGGDMCKEVLRQVDPNIVVKEVRATRGKFVRAEPVAAKVDQERIHHVGVFSKLEDQMSEFDPAKQQVGRSSRKASLDPEEIKSTSPDRLDAYVWAFTDLLLGNSGGTPRVRRV